MLLCGMPSVTLEGEKSDLEIWERLLARLDKLDSVGEGSDVTTLDYTHSVRQSIRRGARHRLLEPSLSLLFSGFTGRTDLSGWITAFLCMVKPRQMAGTSYFNKALKDHNIIGWRNGACVGFG
jgi:hypothetical protein